MISRGLVLLGGRNCEVVIHDFSDLEHSIVHITGNVTGRQVGDAVTDFDFTFGILTNGHPDEDILVYHSNAPNGRLMKSVAILLRSEHDGSVIGAICVNLDVDDLYRARDAFNELLIMPKEEVTAEDSIGDPKSFIRSSIARILEDQGWILPALNKDQRAHIVSALDQQGVFAIRTAASSVADELGISRFTVYNYLKASRKSALDPEASLGQ